MEEVKIKDVKEIIINCDKVIVYQNNGGIIEMTKKQIEEVGNVS